jgi:hypothetical protein
MHALDVDVQISEGRERLSAAMEAAAVLPTSHLLTRLTPELGAEELADAMQEAA